MLIRRDVLLRAASAGAVAASGCATLRKVPTFSSNRISVLTVGAGPDVLLIPGLATSRNVWRSTVDAITGYRYHLVQVRGFAGEQPAANSEPGPLLERLAEEISRFIREQHLSRVAVVGHSLGGTLALMTAASLPGTVVKTMVVDNVPFGAMLFAGAGVTSSQARKIGADARQRLFGSGWQAGMPAIYATMIGSDADRETYIEQAQSSDGDIAGRLFEEVAATDLRPRLRWIRGPVRILYVGSSDIPSAQDPADALYREAYRDVPTATFERISNSRHFIMLDQPHRFWEELRQFLR